MHEMSLAENILQIIEQAGHEQGFTQVRTVWLEIGQLACVEQESLRFVFDVVARGGIAEHARLELIEIAGEGCCKKCAKSFPLGALYEPCPSCGSYDVKVVSGDGMRVKELEVE